MEDVNQNQAKIRNLVLGLGGRVPLNGKCQVKINQAKIEIKQNWETWYPAPEAGFHLYV